MSDYFPTTDPYGYNDPFSGHDEDDSTPHAGEAPQWLKDLRKSAKEGKEAQKQLQALQRENAFLKIEGLDRGSPVFELFSNAYQGEMTAEAIKEAASKYGLVKTAEPAQPQAQPGETPPATKGAPEQPPAQHEDAAAFGRIDAAAAGGSAPELKNDAWKQAPTMQEALALYQAAGGQVYQGE